MFVCHHDNFRMSKRMMMKLWVRCSVQKSWPSSNVGFLAPWVHTLKDMAPGYDVGKISAGCLVLFLVMIAAYCIFLMLIICLFVKYVRYLSTYSVHLAMLCCFQALIIAFTSQSIDRMVYRWHYSSTGTLEGFVNSTLSYFNVSDFPPNAVPFDDAIKPEYNGTTLCRYGLS